MAPSNVKADDPAPDAVEAAAMSEESTLDPGESTLASVLAEVARTLAAPSSQLRLSPSTVDLARGHDHIIPPEHLEYVKKIGEGAFAGVELRMMCPPGTEGQASCPWVFSPGAVAQDADASGLRTTLPALPITSPPPYPVQNPQLYPVPADGLCMHAAWQQLDVHVADGALHVNT